MNRKYLFIALILAIVGAAGALAAVPARMTYEGRLTDAGGSAITTTKTVTFSIFDAAAGGTLVWGPESQELTPDSQGVFNTQLGGTTPLSTAVFSGSDRYLQVTVGGETISPRTRLVTAPYAFTAASAR